VVVVALEVESSEELSVVSGESPLRSLEESSLVPLRESSVGFDAHPAVL
jgi:hypothetical protein